MRLYNVEKYIKEKESIIKNKKTQTENLDTSNNIDGKVNTCYVRVSSQGQANDLERQKEQMMSKYPNHMIIEDIGSGLNFNKRGLKKIIYMAIDGKINELVIAYRDRLTRYELIEELIKKYSNGKITILNEKEQLTPEEEIVQDVMSILNVYVAKLNGIRKYRKNTKNNKKDA